jgi:glycosyltransferase involved in cell wall biosynthesis
VSKLPDNLRVALVHDWLTNMGGAEKVVLALHELFPKAPLYTSAYLPAKLPEYKGIDVRTSFIQKIPLLKSRHKLAFWLRPRAFERFDLSGYDLVISDTTAEAKGVITKPGTLHVCYCNTPTRYYWSGYDEYIRNPGFGPLNPIARLIMPLWIRHLRKWDLKAAQRPQVYIGNSTEVARRIKQYYHREAYALFPCVNVEQFPLSDAKRSGFVVAGRQVPYKRVDLAIEACNQLDLPLRVIGNGSEHDNLRKLAGPTIRFEQANDQELAAAYGSAEALLYPAEEDAGIVPVEAMSTGTPVIAYGKGGVLDSITDGKTGVLFKEQTVEGLVAAIKQAQAKQWDHRAIHEHAQQFSKAEFQAKFMRILEDEFAKFRSKPS